MKQLLSIVTIVTVLFFSCSKKSVPGTGSVAAFNFVNAVVGSSPTVVAFSNSNITYAAWGAISYGASNLFSPGAGNVPLTLARISDTTQPFFQGTLALNADSIYSFFISGDTTAIDTLLTRDIIPYYPRTDSVMGIRFVNLSSGSNPISINLEGSSNGSEADNFPYKGVTGFKQYANNSTTIDYLFVVRDAATGDSLTQFDFVANGSGNNGFGLTDPSSNQNNGVLLTFKNLTIAIYGSESTSSGNSLSTMLIDNY
jgi:uncharacterized protein with LGFP repeats